MSTDNFIVKPGKNNVRDPEHSFKHIPQYGAPVPRNSYWLRRVRDGEVVEIKKEAFEKAKKAAEKKAAEQAKAKTKNGDK